MHELCNSYVEICYKDIPSISVEKKKLIDAFVCLDWFALYSSISEYIELCLMRCVIYSTSMSKYSNIQNNYFLFFCSERVDCIYSWIFFYLCFDQNEWPASLFGCNCSTSICFSLKKFSILLYFFFFFPLHFLFFFPFSLSPQTPIARTRPS